MAAKETTKEQPKTKKVLTSRRAVISKPEGSRKKKISQTPIETPVETEEKTTTEGGERYWEAVGRRKTAVARVRLFTKGDKGIWIGEKSLAQYFPYGRLQKIAGGAIEAMNVGDRFRVTARISGGGLPAQAEAIRHGTARALVLFNPDFRKRLKREGFLTRDPRMKERKKFGLKGARRAPQWAKR